MERCSHDVILFWNKINFSRLQFPVNILCSGNFLMAIVFRPTIFSVFPSLSIGKVQARIIQVNLLTITTGNLFEQTGLDFGQAVRK